MTDVEVLQRFRMLMIEVVAIRKQVETVMMIGGPQGVRGQAMTGMPRGTNDPVAASMQLYEGYAKRLEESAGKLEDLTGRFERIIARIRDDRERVICRYYYGVGMTDAEIGEKISMEGSGVCKIRNEALRKIESFRRKHRNQDANVIG